MARFNTCIVGPSRPSRKGSFRFMPKELKGSGGGAGARRVAAGLCEGWAAPAVHGVHDRGRNSAGILAVLHFKSGLETRGPLNGPRDYIISEG